MRTVLLSPFYPVSNALDTSHRAGWARYWAREVGVNCELLTTESMYEIDTLKRGDQILCYHGMEFKGALNLQSGLTDEILQRVKRLIDADKREVQLISLDEPMPNYGRLLSERGLDPTSAEKLSKLCGKAPKRVVPNTLPKFVSIGDSHSVSQYVPRTVILRQDAKTLHGALEFGLAKLIDILQFEMDVSLKKVERLSFYYGNIDIRHHLMRTAHPEAAAKELVAKYAAQLKVVRALTKKEIEVVLPLPIEDESRVLPKSIMYKGTPFAGSWADRDNLRLIIVKAMKKAAKREGFLIQDHPKHFTGPDGKLTFDVMEKPRSVHIRPAEYRIVHEGLSWLD